MIKSNEYQKICGVYLMKIENLLEEFLTGFKDYIPGPSSGSVDKYFEVFVNPTTKGLKD